jgi:AraC-like DNA-binding protein
MGIQYLKTADSIFNNKDVVILPIQRRLFEELLEYHSSTNNTLKQIEYLNKLLLVDSIFKKTYQYFEPNLIKNFETPRLLREKEELISSLEKKNKKAAYKLWWRNGFLILTLLALLYYIHRQLLLKNRFKILMAKQNTEDKNYSSEKGIGMQISSKIIEDILANLENFETNKLFLSQDLSLHNLASSFGTNPRYLSKVINLQKGKNFCQYINDLRVDYALKELSENAKFRKFTIKAIGADCGFKSGESFSKAFCKKHGLKPSYYIKKLESRFD